MPKRLKWVGRQRYSATLQALSNPISTSRKNLPLSICNSALMQHSKTGYFNLDLGSKACNK